MAQKSEQSYDYICFSDLAYEVDFSDPREIEKKIKRRLKYYNLASYDQERVDYIRQLKNELNAEISLHSKSIGRHNGRLSILAFGNPHLYEQRC